MRAAAAGAGASTRRAFDAAAEHYARTAGTDAVLCAMRARTREALRAAMPPPGHVLELGCGPGLDAVALARLGYRVMAVDLSPAMVASARGLVQHEGLSHAVQCVVGSIEGLHAHPLPQPFDAVFSDLGAFNCVADLDDALAMARRQLRTGGVLVASVMGRRCPWELAWYAARGDWRRAVLRFEAHAVGVPLCGHIVPTRYHTPRAFAGTAVRHGLACRQVQALGVLVPPPALAARLGVRGRTLAALDALERRVAGWPIVRGLGDHFLVVMEAVG